MHQVQVILFLPRILRALQAESKQSSGAELILIRPQVTTRNQSNHVGQRNNRVERENQRDGHSGPGVAKSTKVTPRGGQFGDAAPQTEAETEQVPDLGSTFTMSQFAAAVGTGGAGGGSVQSHHPAPPAANSGNHATQSQSQSQSHWGASGDVARVSGVQAGARVSGAQAGARVSGVQAGAASRPSYSARNGFDVHSRGVQGDHDYEGDEQGVGIVVAKAPLLTRHAPAFFKAAK